MGNAREVDLDALMALADARQRLRKRDFELQRTGGADRPRVLRVLTLFRRLPRSWRRQSSDPADSCGSTTGAAARVFYRIIRTSG
jgi:hypothetical protein